MLTNEVEASKQANKQASGITESVPDPSNSEIYNNVIEMNAALNQLSKEGLIPTIDELAALSPYQTGHLKRFGNYELDLSQISAPPTDDLTFEIEQAEEPVAVEAGANPQALARRAGDAPSQ